MKLPYLPKLPTDLVPASCIRILDLCIITKHFWFKQITTKSKRACARQEKILLNMITARANHSQILAVVGPSGSSKTTFLDALAGRIERRSLKGTILVNGKPMDDNFKRVSGYVMQDDALFPLLTARETLLFTARLRLPGSRPPQVKVQQVEALLEQLGLKHCAETRVGSMKVCSSPLLFSPHSPTSTIPQHSIVLIRH